MTTLDRVKEGEDMASRNARETSAATPKSAAPERLLAATRDAMEHMTIWQGMEVYEAATLDAFHEAVTPALVEALWKAAVGERQR